MFFSTVICPMVGSSLFFHFFDELLHDKAEGVTVEDDEEGGADGHVGEGDPEVVPVVEGDLEDEEGEGGAHVFDVVFDIDEFSYVGRPVEEEDDVAYEGGAGGGVEADPADGGDVDDQVDRGSHDGGDPDAPGLEEGDVDASHEG